MLLNATDCVLYLHSGTHFKFEPKALNCAIFREHTLCKYGFWCLNHILYAALLEHMSDQETTKENVDI